MKRYFSEITLFCNKLNKGIWGIIIKVSKQCVEPSIQSQKLSFLRYSFPLQRNKHLRLLIDIHNISKYRSLGISWTKDTIFLMLNIVQDCQIFPLLLETPPPSIFRSFHQNSYRFSVDIMDFLKLR